jgi:cytochrome oxidase assembly protein ShyY1
MMLLSPNPNPNPNLTPNPNPNLNRPDNDPANKKWHWMDVDVLAESLNAQPILLEAAGEMTPEGGLPVAGTVRVFRQKSTLEDPIEFNAFAPLEALACV